MKLTFNLLEQQMTEKNIAQDFSDICDLPHCAVAIDDKHVAIKSPQNKGSLYFNYRGYFTAVLKVICEAHYFFNFVDIRSYGSNNDSRIFRNSTMGKSFFNEKMNLPPPYVIDECPSLGELTFFLVGDEVFPLQLWLLPSCPGHGLTEE